MKYHIGYKQIKNKQSVRQETYLESFIVLAVSIIGCVSFILLSTLV
jgi:hypothetical protein